MYDFCFSPIYAALLAFGGLAGFAKGSTVSLVASAGAATALAACSWASLRAFRQGKTCKPATALSLALAIALTGVMGRRYLITSTLPAGAVAGVSAAMSGAMPKRESMLCVPC